MPHPDAKAPDGKSIGEMCTDLYLLGTVVEPVGDDKACHTHTHIARYW